MLGFFFFAELKKLAVTKLLRSAFACHRAAQGSGSLWQRLCNLTPGQEQTAAPAPTKGNEQQ